MFHERKHWLSTNLKMNGFFGFIIQSEIISKLITDGMRICFSELQKEKNTNRTLSQR